MNFGSKTSLGIDICEGRINVALLRQFGGEIELVSEEGKGAEFILTFPRSVRSTDEGVNGSSNSSGGLS